jgi:hypothetical protein
MSEVKYKWPKTIGAMADHLYSVRERRLDLDRQSQALKDEETALGEHLLQTFPKQQLEGARGKIGQANVKKKLIPRIDDWDTFYKYLKRTGEFDLLQKRPHEAAFEERWAANKDVPGTSIFEKISVSVSKVGS